MAVLVQISGLQGTGKTTGISYLDPKEVFFIDTDKKGLSWANWRKDFNLENKNYIATSDIPTIYKVLKHISDNRPDIKYVAIDTVNAITTDAWILEMKKANHDKWREMATDIYQLYDMIRADMREDLIVFAMAHIEPYEVDGDTHWRTKFDGKLLTKLNMSGKLNYNLYTQVEHDGKGNNTYSLLTQTDGRTEARSVMGVLPYKMPNDLSKVAELIRERDLQLPLAA